MPLESQFPVNRVPSDADVIGQIRKWSLRFDSPLHEVGFVHFNAPTLRLALRGCSVFSLCISTWYFGVALLVHGGSRAQMPRAIMWACFALLAISIILMTSCRCVVAKVTPGALERATLLLVLVLIPCVYLMDAVYFCMIFGYNRHFFSPGPVECLSDTLIILGLLVLVTGAHLVLPIRWCMLWPLDVMTILSYVVRIILAPTFQENTVSSLLPLLVLSVALHGFGKRSNERVARNHFSVMIHEKMLRCQAEHSLSRIVENGSEDMKRQRPEPAADDMSMPTTTPTGDVFAPEHPAAGFDFGGDEHLRLILELGRKEHWLIHNEHVHLHCDELLGSGSYGFVAAGVYYGSPVAVKVPRQSGKAKTSFLVSMVNELRILRQVRHCNLVLMYGACINTERLDLALVLERIDGVALEDFIRAKDGLEPPDSQQRYRLLVDVSCALCYLHARRPCIVHSDLKASNVLVEASIKAKLCDFGFARLRTRKSLLGGGTLSYMAPEILNNENMAPSTPVDVFSFGRLTYFVSTGIPPYKSLTRKDFTHSAKSGNFPLLLWPPESCFLQESQSLVDQCLQIDPTMRPSMSSVQAKLQSWPDVETARNFGIGPPPTASLTVAADRLRAKFGSKRFGTAPKSPRRQIVSTFVRAKTAVGARQQTPMFSGVPHSIQWLVGISLEVDITAPDLPVQKCDVCFTAAHQMPCSLAFHPPRLLNDWMTRKEFEALCSSLQHALNTAYHADSLPAPFGPVVLCSAFSSGLEPRVLIAQVASAVECPKSGALSSNDCLFAKLVLQDFVWEEPSAPSKVSHHSVPLSPIIEDLVTTTVEL